MEQLPRLAAAKAQITARSAYCSAKSERLSRANVCRGPEFNRDPIQCRGEIRAGENTQRRAVEPESSAEQRHLQRGCAFAVTGHEIAQPQCERVRRSTRGDPEVAISRTPEILHRRLHAGREDFDGSHHCDSSS